MLGLLWALGHSWLMVSFLHKTHLNIIIVQPDEYNFLGILGAHSQEVHQRPPGGQDV